MFVVQFRIESDRRRLLLLLLFYHVLFQLFLQFFLLNQMFLIVVEKITRKRIDCLLANTAHSEILICLLIFNEHVNSVSIHNLLLNQNVLICGQL